MLSLSIDVRTIPNRDMLTDRNPHTNNISLLKVNLNWFYKYGYKQIIMQLKEQRSSLFCTWKDPDPRPTGVECLLRG